MKRDKGAGGRRVSFRIGAKALAMILALCGWLAFVPALRADDAAPNDRRAVRLSSVEGAVHLSQGGQVLAEQALANTPLFEGTRVITGSDGRAEIQFEDGSVARISPESSLSLTVLKGGAGSDRDSEVELNSGLGYFEIQGDNTSSLRVRFGDSEITAGGFTVVRVNLDNKPGAVAVFSGNAHIQGADNLALDLHGGESVTLNATDPNAYNISESIEPDSWDAWNSDRDQELTTASAGRTPASGAMPDSNNPAWSDLDANGSWYNVPDQGYVWSPYEASSPNWDPYGDGSWMGAPGGGYEWISAEPWGYLPYQCGAWNYYGGFGWGWAPGGFCQPWWGVGSGIWGINIGIAPPRYRIPVRPRGGPHPIGPEPVFAVHRHFQAADAVLPARDKNAPVNIAGAAVEPIRPVEVVRAPYRHSTSDFQIFPRRNGSSVPDNSRSGFLNNGAPAEREGRPVAGPTMRQPAVNSYARPAGPSHYSAPSRPAPTSHPSAPAPHPSGGGGGGGGAHPSGGGAHH